MNRPRTASSFVVRAALGAVAVLACAAAHATPAEDAERARLAQERATIDSTYSARVAQCRQRFVVTSCVEDAKRDRRQGLDALHLRQIALDESLRRERARARRAELSVHAAEAARRDAARATPAAGAPSPAASGQERPVQPVESLRSRARLPDESKPRAAQANAAGAVAAERAAREARSRASFEARQKEAAEHREEALKKAADRAKKHPPAAPLPIPKDIKKAP